MAKRIGPQMSRAVDIVRANPGCCILFVATKLHRACAHGKNNAYGYDPVHRAIKAVLIVAKRTSRIYSLTVAS